MSYRNFLNTYVNVYRDSTGRAATPNDQEFVETHPTTPYLTNVFVAVGALKFEDQFLFGRIANPANFALGHKPWRMYKMMWLDDDIQEYDEIEYTVPGDSTSSRFVVENLIQDDTRLSLKQRMCILKEKTTPNV